MHIVHILATWGLRAQLRLLQMLVDYWDPNTEYIQLDGMSLTLEVEDIYFIIGLSHQGEVVKLSACGVGGGVTIEEYITVYCLLDIEIIESQVLVNSIRSLSLRVIVLVLAKIAGFGIHYIRPTRISCFMQ